MSERQNDKEKEANLLCGDSLVNLKTVQSFGFEETIIDLYKKKLSTVHETSIKAHLLVSASMGLSTLLQFCVFAVMFYAGGEIIVGSVDEDGKPTV